MVRGFDYQRPRLSEKVRDTRGGRRAVARDIIARTSVGQLSMYKPNPRELELWQREQARLAACANARGMRAAGRLVGWLRGLAYVMCGVE